MNFMFSWQEQYLTSERSERVRYCSCQENIKFISSRHRVISSMYVLQYNYIQNLCIKYIGGNSKWKWAKNIICIYNKYQNHRKQELTEIRIRLILNELLCFFHPLQSRSDSTNFSKALSAFHCSKTPIWSVYVCIYGLCELHLLWLKTYFQSWIKTLPFIWLSSLHWFLNLLYQKKTIQLRHNLYWKCFQECGAFIKCVIISKVSNITQPSQLENFIKIMGDHIYNCSEWKLHIFEWHQNPKVMQTERNYKKKWYEQFTLTGIKNVSTNNI